RTLYVRSTVVLLFFLFGYFAGNLLRREERIQTRLSANLTLLSGIRRIHEVIVKTKDQKELIAESIPLVKEAFSLGDVMICWVEPHSHEISDFYSNLAHDQQHALQEHLHNELEGPPGYIQGIKQLPPSRKVNGSEAFIAPIRLENRLYGLLYGTITAPPHIFQENVNHLQAICNDLAFAFSHVEDQTNLVENARKLENLYQTAPIGIFTSTVGGKLLFLNQSMAQVLGAATPEAVLEADVPVNRYYMDPHRRESLVNSLFEKQAVVDFEADFKGLDGKIRTVVLAARLVSAVGATESRMEGFAMDMTISRSAERENRILQQELNKSRYYKSITVLAGGIAHEFNNILQAMMGSAYLAQMKIQDRHNDIWGYMQDIQNSGKRAARLCDQMLSYAGKKAMMLKVESPDEALKNVLRIVRGEVRGDVHVEEKLEAPYAQARIDIPSFSEIVNQLITNSMESFENGKGEILIQTGIRACDEEFLPGYEMTRKLSIDDYWYMRISDNGCGIDGHDLQHIFEPIFTTKFQGRGLGLPAVVGTVQKFDGSLGVKQLPEGGTEFILLLPLANTVLVESVEEASVSSEPKKQLQRGGGKIWVVDDEPLICMTIERLLSRYGFDVKTAGDGVEALEQLNKVRIDEVACLLLDVTMPKMGGFETLTRVREFAPDLPVLIMSGFDESDSLDKLKGLNVTGFIHKPFRMEQLEAKLGKILELSKS
ncbi:MAG: response regulator, partial [Kiritimatiellae bacterium]|nr:response regulator [Kiritimatiellia bacterium]